MSDDYRRYNEITDAQMRDHLETLFRSEYREGWLITDVGRLGDRWVVKWERDLRPRGEGQ